jgi:hypothetical protein
MQYLNAQEYLLDPGQHRRKVYQKLGHHVLPHHQEQQKLYRRHVQRPGSHDTFLPAYHYDHVLL